jgi:hypothetical protein
MRRSVSVETLIDQILRSYLNTAEHPDIEWVRATQEGLSGVWSSERFDDWQPPDAR